MKLLLTVLVLIVLPTAWLSLLAGRSIQARELLLDRRLEMEAQQTLEQVGHEVSESIQTALQRVSVIVADTLLQGSDMPHFKSALTSLPELGTFFQEVYLFLDPWGFIYPEHAVSDYAQIADHDVLLGQELAMRLSRGNQQLLFVLGTDVYAFREVRENSRLYAGFVLREDGLLDMLEQFLSAHSTPHIEYRLLQVRPVYSGVGGYHVPELEVRDSFSLGPERLPGAPSFLRDARRHDVLVSGHLGSPLGHIEIGALAVDARDMYAARALQARLVRWSIFLLAIVLLSSTLLLIVMARRQAETARIRSIFIAGLSHDIRTPVTAMRALAESLQHGRVTAPARKQQFLDSIVDECDRLQILIERVLLFFRQEQGGYYQKHPVALAALCERVCQAFHTRHRGRVDVTLDLPDEAVPDVFGDPTALEQALHNLLENAWKYGRPMPDHPDHVIPMVVRLEITSGCLWRRCMAIAVEDAGPGVPPGERRRIFGRFYRGRSGHTAQSGGIGLGLALVWEIVRGHGGRVSVEQSSLGGARFVMRFKPYPLSTKSWKYCISLLRNRSA